MTFLRAGALHNRSQSATNMPKLIIPVDAPGQGAGWTRPMAVCDNESLCAKESQGDGSCMEPVFVALEDTKKEFI